MIDKIHTQSYTIFPTRLLLAGESFTLISLTGSAILLLCSTWQSPSS